MKIRLNNLELGGEVILNDEKTLHILVEKEEEVVGAFANIVTADKIDVLDDAGTVISTLSGTFINPRLVVDSSSKILKFDKKDESADKLQSLISPVSIMFVQMSQDGTLDDITISEHPDMFPKWDENWTGKAGTILREGDTLYRSLHDIINTAQNTRPSETPSMWSMVADPNVEFPEWVQPLGSHDAYSINDKVSHNDKKWVSIVDNNTWQPGVYGWEVV